MDQLATVNVTGNDITNGGEDAVSVVDFGDFWTKDGNIIINTGMADEVASGIGDIGRLTARGDPVFDDDNGDLDLTKGGE